MAGSLRSEEIKPYRSVLVAQFDEGQALSAEKVLRKLKRVLGVRVQDKGRKIIADGTTSDPDGAFVHYQDRHRPLWAPEGVLDRVNYLAVVIVRGNWVAIHTTEKSRRDSIAGALRKGKLGALRMIPSAQLKAAFIQGKARTLWLRGTHRSTSSKPDTKVIGGTDLSAALDPIGDQTYAYSAARCEPENEAIGTVMGVAVNKSSLWVGPSADWEEFEVTVIATLDALEASSGLAYEPLPVLADAANDLTSVENAYDLSITPPEMLQIGPALDPVEAEALAQMELLAFGTQFELSGASRTKLEAEVLRQGQLLGSVEVEFRDGADEIETFVSGSAQPGREPEFIDVLGALRNPENLIVHFDSGHTVQDRQAFSVRHRDLPFEGWAWVPFGNQWEVAREKPPPGTAIGNGDRSLFSWVLDQWPNGAGLLGGQGWLACDDRPGETADFLHVDEDEGAPILTLIHAKGAGSDSAGRELAVVPYETVSAQAVKNLRHLDTKLAAGTMVGAGIPKDLSLHAWHEGGPVVREDFIARLDALGANFRRRVVILQPHVRRDLLEEVRSGGVNHAQFPRLRQLDTLLNAAAADCRSVGAELVVVGAE
jgi:hypothetical protein